MTARQTAAQRDMALVTELLRGAPGERGLDFWVVVARNICARHGVRSLVNTRRPDLPRPGPGRCLSDADVARLRLLADGLTIHQVAEADGYGLHAIKSSLKKTYRALGARNAAHAVALAIRAGII